MNLGSHPHPLTDWRSPVSSTRRVSVATGALLIVATVAVLGASSLDPTLSGTGYLTEVANHPHRLAGAALLYLVAAGASVGIAIALYPVVKRVPGGLALGAVIFRAIEATLYATAVVSLLTILPLSQEFATAPPDDQGPIQAIADSLLSARDHCNLAAIFAFNLGALMYYALLYRSELVPRWLSGWGIAAVLLMIAACLMALFSDNPITGYTLLVLPIAVQELVLAVWLLVKGFRSSTDLPTQPRGERQHHR